MRRSRRPGRSGVVAGLVAGLRAGLVAGLIAVATVAIGPAVAAVAAPTAGAELPRVVQDRDVSAVEAAALARAAVTSDAALADLRAVRTVDGRPVDMRGATRSLSTVADRRRRLAALASLLDHGRPGSTTAAADARRQARAVVAGKDYRPASVPKPFKGALRWIGDRLDPVFGPIGRFVSRVFHPALWLADRLPGGRYLLLALVVGGAAWLTVWFARRRSGASIGRGGSPHGLLVDPAADPEELERRAEQAEVDGDCSLAVRLRYEAGLVRLVRAQRLTLRPETTARQAAEAVGGEDLAVLTATFEEVVYGGRAATAEDVVGSRERWLRILGSRARR